MNVEKLRRLGTRSEWISVSIFAFLTVLYFGVRFYNDCAVEDELNQVATLAPKYGMSEERFKEYAHAFGDFPRLDTSTVDDLRDYIKEANQTLDN
jgi:hypothetical protein